MTTMHVIAWALGVVVGFGVAELLDCGLHR